MNEKVKSLRLSTILEIENVNWSVVESILSSRFQLSSHAAQNLINRVVKRLKKPLNLYWFLKHKDTSDQDRFAAALCEAHGADRIILTQSKTLRAGLSIGYEQSNQFTARKHKSSASIILKRCGLQLRLSKAWQVIMVQLLLTVSAIIFFVLISACFLYGCSVLILFLWEPAVITVAATRNFTIGLALVCMLAAVAGLSGRAIDNLTRLAKRKFKLN